MSSSSSKALPRDYIALGFRTRGLGFRGKHPGFAVMVLGGIGFRVFLLTIRNTRLVMLCCTLRFTAQASIAASGVMI